jgi:endonuclease-3 related protein
MPPSAPLPSLTVADSLGREQLLRDFHRTLYDAWGCQHWWPAASQFEVIVGAYLTQNTSWTNVEQALSQLRAARLLTLNGVRKTPLAELEMLIRSSGYFRQKALRLKTFVQFVDRHYKGLLVRMFAQPTGKLREELLTLNGVGQETADSILLYAGQHAVFVVDTYTRRILERHDIVPANTPYEEIRGLCERALSRELPPHVPPRGKPGGAAGASHLPSRMSLAKREPLAQVYNDMHGLIVGIGKNFCFKSKPRCEECPLRPYLPQSPAPKVSALPVL